MAAVFAAAHNDTEVEVGWERNLGPCGKNHMGLSKMRYAGAGYTVYSLKIAISMKQSHFVGTMFRTSSNSGLRNESILFDNAMIV